jgi:hypothetical protein
MVEFEDLPESKELDALHVGMIAPSARTVERSIGCDSSNPF